jgi:hypothetical protein
VDELRVPKHRVAVEVVSPGGGVRRVELFLAEAAEAHAGPERPSDLLDARSEFFPVLDAEAGGVTFLHCGGIAVVRFGRALERDEADEVTLPTEHEVVVHLVDGSEVRGLVSYLRPGAVRLVDFLNEPPPFLRVLQGDAVALVNKRHVARIDLASP